MVIACPVEWQIFHHEGGNKAIFQRHPLARVSSVTFTRAATDSLKIASENDRVEVYQPYRGRYLSRFYKKIW